MEEYKGIKIGDIYEFDPSWMVTYIDTPSVLDQEFELDINIIIIMTKLNSKPLINKTYTYNEFLKLLRKNKLLKINETIK